MRELVLKNLTSENKKRRDLYITETIDNNGIRTVTRRHSLYIIGNHTEIIDPKQLDQYQKLASSKENKRHIFILKKRDTMNRKDIFICDVVGKFYAVISDEIYPVAFKHSFEIDFLCTTTKEGGGEVV